MKCSRCAAEIEDDSLFCRFCGKRQAAAPSVQRKKTRRPKGSGTVYKLKGARARPWVAELYGKKLGCFATSPQATKALDDFLAAHHAGPVATYTLQQVYNSFCSSARFAKLGEKGAEGLAAAWKRLEPLAARRAVDLKVADFQQIIDTAQKEKRYKALTPEEYGMLTPAQKARYDKLKAQPDEPLGFDGKNRIKQLVSHLYSEMMRLELTDRNPAELLVLPAQPKPQKRNFTEPEIRALQQHDADDNVKMILIYLETGMRLNELLKLPRTAYDPEQKTITGGSKTQAGRDRIIPVTPRAQSYVEYFYQQGGAYLIERDGKPIPDDYFRKKIFYATLDALGIQYQQNGRNVLTPHRARHTFTAQAIQGGVAPEALTEILGHAKYDTTVEKYADHLDVDYLRGELSKKG